MSGVNITFEAACKYGPPYYAISNSYADRITVDDICFFEPSPCTYYAVSAVVDGDYDSLREGQNVEYYEGTGPKGPRAEDVRVID